MEPGDSPPGQPRNFRMEIITINDDVESLQIIEGREEEEPNVNMKEEDAKADTDAKSIQDDKEAKSGTDGKPSEDPEPTDDNKLSEELAEIANYEKLMLEEDEFNFATGEKPKASETDDGSAAKEESTAGGEEAGDSQNLDANGELPKPYGYPFYWNNFESKINQEEVREAERTVYPREYNYQTTLVNISDEQFDKLMSREFACKLPTEVEDFVEDIKDFMEATREKMVTIRRENRILMNILREDSLEGTDPYLKNLLVNLIVNRRKISKLEIENDILIHQNEAFQKEILKFKPKDYTESNVLNLEDRRRDFVEEGMSVVHLEPPPKRRNRHMVPGNYIDCYDENGKPLPVGKLTHILQLLSTANGTEVTVEKVEGGSPVSMDDDAAPEEGRQEDLPDVSPEMAVRLQAKQLAEHQVPAKTVENKTTEVRKESPPKKAARCISDQKPTDLSKIKTEVKAKFTQNKDPKDAKPASDANKVKTTGVYLPPLNPFDDAEPVAAPASPKPATPLRAKDSDSKPIKPPKKLLKKGLDCIKPNSELLYQGSIPINSASAVVQPEPPKKLVPEPPKMPRPTTPKRPGFRMERPPSGKVTSSPPVVKGRPEPRKDTPPPTVKGQTPSGKVPSSPPVVKGRPEPRKDTPPPTVKGQTPSGKVTRSPPVVKGRPEPRKDTPPPTVKGQTPAAKPIRATKKMQANVLPDVHQYSSTGSNCKQVEKRSNGTPTQVPSSIHFPQPPDSLVGKQPIQKRFTNVKSDVVLSKNQRPPSGKPGSRVVKGRASVSGAVLANDTQLDASKVANQHRDSGTRTPTIRDSGTRTPTIRGSRSKDVLTPGSDSRNTPVDASPVALHTTTLDLSQPVPQMTRSSTKVLKRPPTGVKRPVYMDGKSNDNSVTLPKIVGSTKVLNASPTDKPSPGSRMGLLNNASILPNRPVFRPPTPNKKRTTCDRTRSTPSPEGGSMQARSGTAASKSLGCIKEFSGDEDNSDEGTPV